jgi:hypothetical protein
MNLSRLLVQDNHLYLKEKSDRIQLKINQFSFLLCDTEKVTAAKQIAQNFKS